MTIDELIRYAPRVYHMAQDGSWPSISRHGLLSTEALLELSGMQSPEKDLILSARRPSMIRLTLDGEGDAYVRDQKPLNDRKLAACLKDGLTASYWYQLLNRMVFFWLSEQKLLTLLSARAYRDCPHLVLTVDTRALVARHRDRIRLSPINSGTTSPMAQPRGRDTFLSIEDYPFDAWRKKRGLRGHPIVELAVEKAVPDIGALVVRAERRKRSALLEVVHSNARNATPG